MFGKEERSVVIRGRLLYLGGGLFLPGGVFLDRKFRERWFMLLMGSFLVVYIIWPLAGMFFRADWSIVASTTRDKVVLGALWRSVWTAAAATGVIALFGTPLAYFLARQEFRGKSVLEAVIDVPIMVPHTVAGIAVLMTFSPRPPSGRCW